MKRLLPLVATCIAIPALALDPLPSATLLENCADRNGRGFEVCRAWLHGFIGGAFASRTAREVEPGARPTIRERAARTRMTRGRDVYGRNVNAGYCLPKGVTLEELVGNVEAHAKSAKEMPEHANQLVLGMLRKHYPCPRSATEPDASGTGGD